MEQDWHFLIVAPRIIAGFHDEHAELPGIGAPLQIPA